jgi:hypothetical protein
MRGVRANQRVSFRAALKSISFLQISAFLGMVALCFWLFWNLGLTCGDDYFASTNPARHGSFWNGVKNLAVGQSRFYQYYAVPAWQWATQDESTSKLFIIRSLTLLLNFAAYAFFLSQLLRENKVALLIGVSFFAALVADYGFTGFHALPLWFGMPSIFLHFSLGCIIAFTIKKKRIHYFLSLLCFSVSLLYYESFLLNLAAIAFIIVASNRRADNEPVAFFAWRTLVWDKRLWAFYGVALIYVAAYVSFQKLHPQSYAGFQLSIGNFGAVLQTAWKFSISGIALGYSGRWSDLLNVSFAPAVLFFSVVATAATTFAVLALTPEKRRIFGGWHAAMLAVLLFSPNVLHALTTRYQEWARIDPRYLGTYYSAFPLWLIIMLTLAVVIHSKLLRTVSKYAVAIMMAGLFLGFNHNLRAKQTFFETQRVQAARHRDNQTAIRKITELYPQTNAIVSKTLFLSEKGTLIAYDYWALWTKQNTGKQIKYSEILGKDIQGQVVALERLQEWKFPVFLTVPNSKRESGSILLILKDTNLLRAEISPVIENHGCKQVTEDQTAYILQECNKVRIQITHE